MKQIQGKAKILLGTRAVWDDGRRENIYLRKPEWQCGWYWAFGGLGNSDCHYHLNGYQQVDRQLCDKDGKPVFLTERRNICMHDALLEDYELNPVIKDDLWQFCEQALTIYTLKGAAEVLVLGGSHNTTHAHKAVVLQPEMAAKINDEILPELLQGFWNRFGGNP